MKGENKHMSQKISVIVPIYNVEKYLPKCIESIINQTHKNLEIILVDDASPDQCGEICDDYAIKDKRIRVIHKKENEGIAAARNIGLDVATGDLIGFVDSDDYIDHRMYETLLNLMQDADADIAFCDLVRVQDGQECKELIMSGEIKTLTNIEALNGFFDRSHLQTVVVWNKLYRRELFECVRFPFGKQHEDAFVAHQLLYHSKKIVYTKDQFYYYLKRSDSVMGRFTVQRLDALDARKERIEFFREKGLTEFYGLSAGRYLNDIIYHYVRAESAGFDPQILASLRKRFRKEYLYYRVANHFSSIKGRFKKQIFYISPLLYKWAFGIWQNFKKLKKEMK